MPSCSTSVRSDGSRPKSVGLDAGNRRVDPFETGQSTRIEVAGQQNLPRAGGGELVHRRNGGGRSAVLGDPQLSGREIGGGEPEDRGRSLAVARDGNEKRRLARCQSVGIGEGSGRDHTHDFAADESTRFARVLDLLANGNPESPA